MKYSLIPLNSPPDIAENYFHLTYTFETNSMVSGVDLSLASRNNTYCGMGLYSYDGQVSHLSAELGQKVSALIRPEKIVYQTDKTRCRQEPYNDILIKRILNIMETNCSQVCRPWYYWICNPNLERMFPVCSRQKTMIALKMLILLPSWIQF